MKRTIASIGTLAVGLTFAMTSAGPAAAADTALTVKNASGTVIARATWDDSHDNLCVRSRIAGTMATVQIGPIDGAPRATARDAGFGKPGHCTGNLSVAEDRRFWMRLEVAGRSTDTTFYT